MDTAILTGSMALPRGLVDVASLKKTCSLDYLPMGADEPLTLIAYEEDDDYLYVPRQLGLRVCKRLGIPYTDATSAGVPVTFPRCPPPRDYQVDALEDLQTQTEGFYDFLFRARTGWGKTIGSLILAARLGVSTLVIVDQENLKDQWIAALVEHFGIEAKDIGLVQGKVCKFEGCAVTIAMVQTLSQKDFPWELYNHFGLVLIDETHVIGAPTFSTILLRFSAMYRIGVSATPKRRDGLQKVLDYNLGKVRVYIADEHEENSVYVLENTDATYSWYANISPKNGRFIAEVTEDAARNYSIAEAACHLYDTGREVLVLSDRIEQLQHLRDLCGYLGIPDEEMGVYAGYNPVYRYAKDPTPARRPQGYERGTEYTPVSLQLIAKRMNKKSLDAIKADARIIFATYGMFQKGVDVPRLNGGIDANPRSQAEQVHGRILRKVEGKLRSIWITIVDTNSFRSMYSFTARLPDYLRNNASISTWTLDEGPTPCHPNELKAQYLSEVKRQKSLRIETNSDGLNTLVSQTDRVTLARQHARDTSARLVRDRPASPTGSSRAGSIGKSSARTSTTPSPAKPSPYLKRRRR